MLGMRHEPHDVPASLMTPATLPSAPFHVLRSGGDPSTASGANVPSSAYQAPSPCLHGITSSCPTAHRLMKGAAVLSTRSVASRRTNSSCLFGRRTRAQRASQRIWVLQIPRTGPAGGGEPTDCAHHGRRSRSLPCAGSRRTRSRQGGRPRRHRAEAPRPGAGRGPARHDAPSAQAGVVVVVRTGKATTATAAVGHSSSSRNRALDERIREELRSTCAVPWRSCNRSSAASRSTTRPMRGERRIEGTQRMLDVALRIEDARPSDARRRSFTRPPPDSRRTRRTSAPSAARTPRRSGRAFRQRRQRAARDLAPSCPNRFARTSRARTACRTRPAVAFLAVRRRPEARGVRRQRLVTENHGTVGCHAELELRVGDDDPASPRARRRSGTAQVRPPSPRDRPRRRRGRQRAPRRCSRRGPRPPSWPA